MKVLLVYPRTPAESAFVEVELWPCEPLALEYLAAGARLEGHEPRLLDLRLRPKDLARTLAEFRPDLVGVTGYSFHVFEALAVCREAKELNPGCLTVVGGHHATLRPSDFFDPAVDFVVCGEGVRPFQGLLRALEEGRPPGDLPGVHRRLKDKYSFGGRPEALEIDSLPFPDRTLNREDRASYFLGPMKPLALLRTSLGCAFRCSFCSLWKIMKGRYLVRESRKVVAELERIEEPFVHLVDDEPWLNKPRMMDLAREISAAGIRKRYITYCRVDTLAREPELMEAWQGIGLEALLMGVEAVSSKELADYDKRIQLHQIEAALKRADELGLTLYAQFIIRPDYSLKDFTRLERFITRHKLKRPCFTVMTPLPGTESFESAPLTSGRLPDGRPNWPLFDLQHPLVETALPREVFLEQIDRLRRTFAYH